MRPLRIIGVASGLAILATLGTLHAKPVAFKRAAPFQGRFSQQPTPPPTSSAPINPQCDNRVGKLDACQKPVAKACIDRTSWSSSCESLLSIGFQPRIAENIATCVSKERLSLPSCEPRTTPKCVREAIAIACPEPDAADRCDALFQTCRLAAMRPKFTRDECVQMLSAMVPGPDRDGVFNQLSPSMDECGRESAVPFQPYAKPQLPAVMRH